MNPSVYEDSNMTMPVLQSFCCQPAVNATIFGISYEKFIIGYCISALITSFIGICGALYQLYPKKRRYRLLSQEYDAFMRQNYIICWLAVSDLLVTIGILIRSSVWLAAAFKGSYSMTKDHGNNTQPMRIFCAFNRVWIEYFYLCSYAWTLCYAIEVHRILCAKSSKTVLYHCISWVVSGILMTAGIIPVYYPSKLSCEDKVSNLLPHYLLSYIPMVVVMCACPILYHKSSKAIMEALKMRAHFTDNERKIHSRLQIRFMRIAVAFWFCWIGNLLLGPAILIVHFDRSLYYFIIILQEYNAIANPLQAFLNSLVYNGYIGCQLRSNVSHNDRPTDEETSLTSPTSYGRQAQLLDGSLLSSGETSPLLRSWHHS